MSTARSVMTRVAAVAAGCLLLGAQPGWAQITTGSTATPLGRALMDERNGAFADAATQYADVLRGDPANLGALTGMAHVLPRLDRRGELDSLIRLALRVDSTSTGVLEVAVRNFAAAGRPDSAQRYTERWSGLDAGDDEPYRAWSESALAARDVGQARHALELGRARLGTGALGIEWAEMLQRNGDIAGAVREWLAVVHATPPFRDGAVNLLVQVPPAQRSVIRQTLLQDGSRDARQMLGLMLVQWGEVGEGTAMVRAALPDDAVAAVALLHDVIDDLRGRTDKVSRQASAETLEALASRQPGDIRARTLTDAARAYADADDDRDARRVLALVGGTGGAATAASATLVDLLVAEGKPADADRTLRSLGTRIDADEHDRLARRIALAWAVAGDFVRAQSLVATDSSTQGFDLRGRLRLYQGDLAGANDLLKLAGPFDDRRESALQRITLLTLIQAVGLDSSRALGHALLLLAGGDSAHAVPALDAAANTFPSAGAAETRLLAGTVALAIRDTAAALRLAGLADVNDAPAAAAAARLEQARINVAGGHTDAARATLEQLIVKFPESAVVPEARRLRDSLATSPPAGGR